MKCWGAHVITTCSTDAVSLVKHLEADVIVDYTSQNVADVLKSNEKYVRLNDF